MSVTMSLYKVIPNVEYKGYYLDFLTKADFVMGDDGFYPYEKKEKELGAPLTEKGTIPDNMDDESLYFAYKEWEDKQEVSVWSDGKKHDKINLTYLNSCSKSTRGWKRIAKRLNACTIHTFNNGCIIQKYIPVDEVEYAQGWFFTKRFFNKEVTCVYCVSKKQMQNFFNQYVDYNSHDTRGKEAVERFLNAWEDGMIFECAW